MRIYIAGPMTGLVLRNYPAFHAEAYRLRAMGYVVLNPAEINEGLEHEGWAACMRRDLDALRTCDAVQLLPGWEISRGAKREVEEARKLGLKVFYPANMLMNVLA
jgi:hypothetical protein